MTHKVNTICTVTNQPCRTEANGNSLVSVATLHIDLNPSPLAQTSKNIGVESVWACILCPLLQTSQRKL